MSKEQTQTLYTITNSEGAQVGRTTDHSAMRSLTENNPDLKVQTSDVVGAVNELPPVQHG